MAQAQAISNRISQYRPYRFGATTFQALQTTQSSHSDVASNGLLVPTPAPTPTGCGSANADDPDPPNSQRQCVLLKKMDVVHRMIEEGAIQGAAKKLKHDIQTKFDGVVGGNSKDDWVEDGEAQLDLYAETQHLYEDLVGIQTHPPPKPTLRVTFAHKEAVGLAWSPINEDNFYEYRLERHFNAHVPVSSPLIVAITAGLLGLVILTLLRRRQYRAAMASGIIGAFIIVGTVQAIGIRDVVIFISKTNPYRMTFVDTEIEQLNLDPDNPVVSYRVIACNLSDVCTASDFVEVRPSADPTNPGGKLITDFLDPADFTVVGFEDDEAVPTATASARVKLQQSVDEGFFPDGMDVLLSEFSNDPQSPSIMLDTSLDDSFELSGGNAVVFETGSSDCNARTQEQNPRPVRIRVRLISHQLTAPGNWRLTSFMATVPGWLCGDKPWVIPKREFLQRTISVNFCNPKEQLTCSDNSTVLETTRLNVASDPAWGDIDRVVISFDPVGPGDKINVELSELSTCPVEWVDTNLGRLMIHYHGWYAPEGWGADNQQLGIPRDYPQNIGAPFYPQVLSDPAIDHYINNRDGIQDVGAARWGALLDRHVGWMQQTGAGTVAYSYFGKGADAHLEPPKIDYPLFEDIGPLSRCPNVEPNNPVEGSAPNPRSDTQLLQRNRVDGFLNRLTDKGMRMSILINAIQGPPYKGPCHVVREIKAILATAGHADGFFYDYSRDGLPVFFTFSTARNVDDPDVPPIPPCLSNDPDNESWCTQLNLLTGRYQANVTGQAISAPYMNDGGFSGLNHYDPLFIGPAIDGRTTGGEPPYDWANDRFAESRLRTSPSKLWVPTYSAGFDKTRAAQHDPTNIERISRHWDSSSAPAGSEFRVPCGDEFEYFDDYFDLAEAHQPDYIGIVEFNEWYEGTSIEPATLPTFATPASYPSSGCTYQDDLTPAGDFYDFFWRGTTNASPISPTPSNISHMYLNRVRNRHLQELFDHGW